MPRCIRQTVAKASHFLFLCLNLTRITDTYHTVVTFSISRSCDTKMLAHTKVLADIVLKHVGQ